MLSKVRTAVLEMRCPILQHSLVVNCRKLIYIVKSDYKFRRALRGMLDADHVTLCVNPSPKLIRLVKEIVETYSKEQAGRARFLGDGPETRYELCYEFECVATPTPLPDEVYAMLSKVRTAVLEMRCSILQHSLVVNCRKLIYIVKSDYKFRRALRGMLDADHVTLCVNPSPKLMRLVKEIVETYSKEQAGRARFLGDGPETRYELCYEFETDTDITGDFPQETLRSGIFLDDIPDLRRLDSAIFSLPWTVTHLHGQAPYLDVFLRRQTTEQVNDVALALSVTMKLQNHSATVSDFEENRNWDKN
ncbi:unnamed protein product [Heligmosomoides polygyrus]|uniref:DNA polymerase n=1 Tax=Heligmosomoides polygyrus TaxID=6339 RepID=A0A183GTZ9_HELPZ|nr:unnamed protein product [Heligmosomoides polygyrus]